MTSQPGQQTITIHILSNISRSKGNQTMKLGQLIEYKQKYSSKIFPENETGTLVPYLFLFFKKV